MAVIKCFCSMLILSLQTLVFIMEISNCAAFTESRNATVYFLKATNETQSVYNGTETDFGCYDNSCACSYVIDDDDVAEPTSPLIQCNFLPMKFLVCAEPLDLHGNDTARQELGYGCSQYGGQKYEDVQKTNVSCTVLPGIECRGERVFFRGDFPCIKYNGHYFVTTLLYSILLGFLGLDRFCLGHTGTAVGKLLTLGGIGVWWIVDIILLVTGSLLPEDGSNWEPYSRD